MKQSYSAVWWSPGLTQLANVTIVTNSIHNAMRSARRLAKQFGLPNTPFELRSSGQLLHHGV